MASVQPDQAPVIAAEPAGRDAPAGRGEAAAREDAGHLRSLTSLRFVAAAVVMLMHFYDAGHRGIDQPGRPIRTFLVEHLPALGQGHLMVDFFFLLSGFVLAYVYESVWQRGRFDYPTFLVKRFARIYPLHLATFLFFVVAFAAGRLAGIAPTHEDHFSLQAAVSNLLLVQAWGVETQGSFNVPSWSISAEWAAYLLFPAVLLLMRRLPALVGLALAVGWFVGGYLLFSTPDLQMTSRTYDFGVLRILCEFPLGVALFYALGWLSGRAGLVVFGGAVVVAVVAMSLHLTPIVTVLGFGGIIWGAAAAERAGRLNWLRGDALVYLGEISYSIYMTHFAVQILLLPVRKVLHVPRASLGFDLLLLGALPATVLVSHLSYQYLETPARRWLTRRFSNWSVRNSERHTVV